MIQSVTLESACAVTLKGKEETCSESPLTFSGTLCEGNGKCYVITSFSPLTHYLCCPEILSASKKNYWILNSNFNYTVTIQCKQKVQTHRFCQLQAKPILAWNSNRFEHVLMNFLASANVPDAFEKEEKCCAVHKTHRFLSWFLILGVTTTNPVYVLPRINVDKNLYQGKVVCTKSFPFGYETLNTFGGSVSRGIICNAVDNILMIIDARVLPGSEGGAVTDLSGTFLGVIVSPLVLKTGGLSGFSIACSMIEVLTSFKNISSTKYLKMDFLFEHMVNNKNSLAANEIVVVENTKGWGSGVIVAISHSKTFSSVVVATCRHVVQPVADSEVCVQFYGVQESVKMAGQIVFKSEISWFDFALVKVDLDFNLAEKLRSKISNLKRINQYCYILQYTCDYTEGSAVFVKGHCLLEHHKNPPTITHGVLSKVVYASRSTGHTSSDKVQAVMLQTTCIVHDGASGGALVTKRGNNFLGLVVNNIKEIFDKEKYVLYPDVNFILPAQLFMSSLHKFLLGKVNPFQELINLAQNGEIKNSWFLQMNENANLYSKL